MSRFIPAARVINIRVSPSTAAAQRTRDLKAAGRDIVDMTVGEPDFDTPENVRTEGKAAIDRNETRYTPVNGTPRLRDAIQADFKRRLGLDYALDEICGGGGGKQILFLALMANVDWTAKGGQYLYIHSDLFPQTGMKAIKGLVQPADAKA